MLALKVIVWIALISLECNTARILGVISIPSYSHQVVFHPLWKELSLRGHQVTVIAPDPINDPSLVNLTEIDVHDITYTRWNEIIEGKFEKEVGIAQTINLLFRANMEVNERELEHHKIQDLIKNKNHQFDLVIAECINPIMFAFAERFKCPSIGVASFEGFSTMYTKIGNPLHPLINPESTIPISEKLNFLDRLTSVYHHLVIRYYFNVYDNLNQKVVEKHFGINFPKLKDIVANMSLMFVNMNHIIQSVRGLNPNVIPIGGGIHIKSAKPLPKIIQLFLDNSPEGVIYFSLGTNIKSKCLSNDTMRTLLNAFSEVPYKILWKFELDILPNKPENVMIYKWIPQQDVLRHRNIKLFITQGGLQSLEEALYFQIPIVGIPFFADQAGNVKKFIIKDLGILLDHKTLSKSLLTNAINEVISNAKYKNNIKRISELIMDQPMTPLHRAVWWTEYVLRHNGAHHLKSTVLSLPAYQYYFLDIIGLLILIIFLTFYFISKIFRLINCLLNKSKIKQT